MLISWKTPVLIIVLVAAGAAGIKLFKDETNVSLLEVVEGNGSRLLGTRVDVESAEAAWDAGAFSITKLEIANPGGFSDSNMITVQSIRGEGDLISGTIDRLDFDGVDVLIEFRGADSNFEVIGERITDNAGGGGLRPEGESRDQEKDEDGAGDESGNAGKDEESSFPEEWRVGTVAFDNIRVTVRADWTSEVVMFDAPRMALESLDGEVDRVTRSVVTGFFGNVLSSGAKRVDNERLKENLLERARTIQARTREVEAKEKRREDGGGD